MIDRALSIDRNLSIRAFLFFRNFTSSSVLPREILLLGLRRLFCQLPPLSSRFLRVFSFKTNLANEISM